MPTCQNVIELDHPIVQKELVTCGCGHQFCGHCFEPWHPSKTCRQAQGRHMRYINRRVSRRCPRCQTRVEKNEGCPQMVCTNCRCYWCWNCGKENAPGIDHSSCWKQSFFMDVKYWQLCAVWCALPLVICLAPILVCLSSCAVACCVNGNSYS